MVMHVRQGSTPDQLPTAAVERRLRPDHDPNGVSVGFVVSRAVGNAVARNRVKRRLRHLVAEALTIANDCNGPAVPAGTAIVIRALPAAAQQPDRLGRDFDRAWRRAYGKRPA